MADFPCRCFTGAICFFSMSFCLGSVRLSACQTNLILAHLRVKITPAFSSKTQQHPDPLLQGHYSEHPARRVFRPYMEKFLVSAMN